MDFQIFISLTSNLALLKDLVKEVRLEERSKALA